MLNLRLNLDASMKLFYTMDGCCRVLVCGFMLPLKVLFLTYGWRPTWMMQCMIWVEDRMVDVGLMEQAIHSELQGKKDAIDCFIMDCIEYCLNNAVVVFVLFEYIVRYEFHDFIFLFFAVYL